MALGKIRFGIKLRLESYQHEFQKLYDDAVNEVIIAEKQGFDSAWLNESHMFPNAFSSSPLTMLTPIACATRKILLGTSIVPLTAYHPLRFAEDTTFIDIISGGRLIVGVGIGSPVDRLTKAFNVPKESLGTRFEESINLIRRFWTEDNVTFTSNNFCCTNVSMAPKPTQKPPPIWIGAYPGNKKSLNRAARLGDAWIPTSILDLRGLKRDYATYRDELRKLGKPLDGREYPIQRDTYVAKNNETAHKDVGPLLRKIYADVQYTRGFAVQDPSGSTLPLEETSIAQVIDGRFIVGGPDECIQQIERYVRELWVNHFILRTRLVPPFRSDDHRGLDSTKAAASLRLFGEKVLPHFSNRLK